MTEKILYTPSEVAGLIESGVATLIDIRDPEVYAEGHLPGAVNVKEVFYYLSETTEEGLEALHKEFEEHFSNAGLEADKIAIIYEDSLNTRYGGSCRGYWLLKYLGQEKVGILDGGYSAWTEDGQAVETEPAQVERSSFVVKPQTSFLATMDEVKDVLNGSQVKLLDNRDRVEWEAKSSSPYGVDFAPRKGRIPGAKWIEWYDFMESKDGDIQYFKSPDQIRTICAEQGFHPDDDIIIYCFKGARAANTYVALKEAGFKNLRNYLGSWNEWSRYEELPAEEEVLN